MGPMKSVRKADGGGNMAQRKLVRNIARIGKFALGCFILLGTLSCSAILPSQARFEPVTVQGMDPPEGNPLAKMTPAKLISLGNGFLVKNNVRLALLHFGVALEKMPKSVGALVGVGKAFYAEGNLSKAQEAFATALKEDPGNISSLLYSGKIDRRQGNPDAALDELGKALEKKKNDPEIMTELAGTYDDLGQESRAELLFRQVVKITPDQAASYNNLGYNLLLQGRYSEAISSLSRAYAIDPKDKTVQCNLGAAYALSSNDESALKVFKYAVGKAEAYNNLGYFSMVNGHYGAAERYFARALQIKPTLYLKAEENLSRLKRIASKVDMSHAGIDVK
jgi:Flp pilus assembly protein TadD